MAKLKKRKQNGVCIFCGKESEVTDEHIFPESWYPDDTPKDLWLWQGPACYACNHVQSVPSRLMTTSFAPKRFASFVSQVRS